VNLIEIFQDINERHFDGFLDAPDLRWNSRLTSSAGRFIPGHRGWFEKRPAAIEIASYLKAETDSLTHIADTLAHEMIHYWLWVRRRPYGHTGEFLAKMRLMGVSRYNKVPKTKGYRHVYECPACRKEYFSRRKLGSLACLRCCKQLSHGKFDSRFKLVWVGPFSEKKTEKKEQPSSPSCASLEG
jgi:predicted SprT family Zn-dependent metalloprotease